MCVCVFLCILLYMCGIVTQTVLECDMKEYQDEDLAIHEQLR